MFKPWDKFVGLPETFNPVRHITLCPLLCFSAALIINILIIVTIHIIMIILMTIQLII